MGGSGGWVWGYQVSTLEGYVCISSRGPPLPLDLELYSRAAQKAIRDGVAPYSPVPTDVAGARWNGSWMRKLEGTADRAVPLKRWEPL